MLPQLNRLTGNKNFQRVEAEGRVFQSANFGVAYVERKDDEPSRYAFIVSTKISKIAVERNRVKRIMREAVRQSLFESKPGYDICFLTKQSIMRIPTDLIVKEIKKSLRDAGLTK
jgi:ribonuclease P protein component